MPQKTTPLFQSTVSPHFSTPVARPVAVFLSTKKKYKPVTQKVRAIVGELPQEYRIVRNCVGDPLATLPMLNPNPPPFVPTGRYTQERRDAMRAVH
ncbi:hypothetical protein L226DRAFT_466888, partial [Lentinus tigrinus ALCF2SS1-7]|uniref:uncharacterized protein n=1 Tax=Lentinus tigrinus ALCF2SS1-7 TaxID=1328758 RepID=UPI001165CF1A